MRTRMSLSSTAVLAVGTLLGWMAGSGQLDVSRHVNAARQRGSADPIARPSQRASGDLACARRPARRRQEAQHPRHHG